MRYMIKRKGCHVLFHFSDSLPSKSPLCRRWSPPVEPPDIVDSDDEEKPAVKAGVVASKPPADKTVFVATGRLATPQVSSFLFLFVVQCEV